MVILTKESREIDIHDIDNVIINHEPATYDTKKQISKCRYCNHMYQSPMWLAQHEAECDLRADSEFKKLLVKQHSAVNSIENPETPESENQSPENEPEIQPEMNELERSSPIFYMPAHNHIDAYQTNHNPSHENQSNNEYQIYPHQDEIYEQNNEIILEPMDSQPAETTEPATLPPIQPSPPPSPCEKQLSSTPTQCEVNDENQAKTQPKTSIEVEIPKMESTAKTDDVLKDDNDSIVIYQDHRDSQETIYTDNEEESPFNKDKNCENENSESDMSEGEETASEDDSETETVSG